MRQRRHLPRIDHIERLHRLARRARLRDAHGHVKTIRRGVRHDADAVGPRRRRYDARQEGFIGRPEQRPELRRAVDIEQHKFAAVRRKLIIKRRDDGRGLDGMVQRRLEGQHRRQAIKPAVAGMRAHPPLQRLGEPEGFPRGVHRKGIILERIELRQDAEPGRLGESREDCRDSRQSGEAGEFRDADHR